MKQQDAARYDSLYSTYQKGQNDLQSCRDALTGVQGQRQSLQNQVDELNRQLPAIKENNTQLLKQLETMSVISSSQAESIRKSLENMGAKDVYIQDLQAALARRDSLNMALVLNLKGVLGNLNDEDVNIKVEKGVIYIDISDKMLFNTGSYVVRERAKEVLGKVALVLKNQPDIEFLVEGHTDNVPYAQGVLQKEW